jgi:hypothetical protein
MFQKRCEGSDFSSIAFQAQAYGLFPLRERGMSVGRRRPKGDGGCGHDYVNEFSRSEKAVIALRTE